VIKSETIYKDGFQFGLSQEWYPSGQLKWEFYWKKGERFSESKEWHPSGKLKSLKKIEWGIQISYDEWDEIGNLVETDRIDSRPGDYSLLERFRQINIEKQSDSE
jgi:antitoxin component YwqK of YwqJK toxin-antitoxin module